MTENKKPDATKLPQDALLEDELDAITGGVTIPLSFDYMKKGTTVYSCEHLQRISDFWQVGNVLNVQEGRYRSDSDPCPHYDALSPSYAQTPGYQYCRFCKNLKPG